MRRTLSEPSLGRTRSSVGAFTRSRRFEPPEPFWVDYSRRYGGYPSGRSPPSAPSTPKRPASTRSPQPPGVRSVQRSTSTSEVAPGPAPMHEVVPGQLKSKVLKLVRDSPPLDQQHRGVVVIEMSWSESGYLPSHAQPSSQDPDVYVWGEKYKRLAAQLGEAVANKGVTVVHFKTPSGLKKSQGIYDRFSEWERRLPQGMASNVSHRSSGPSRIGAFEVHLVQSTWDPERCCPGTLRRNQWHQGPATSISEGIYCAACVEAMRDERPVSHTKAGDRDPRS